VEKSLRFCIRACATGLVLAYGLVFPLKWAGLMPSHLTWLKLAVAPAIMFGMLGSLFVGVLWLGQRWWLLFVPTALLGWVVMLTLM
jgi:hypothetical protein